MQSKLYEIEKNGELNLCAVKKQITYSFFLFLVFVSVSKHIFQFCYGYCINLSSLLLANSLLNVVHGIH